MKYLALLAVFVVSLAGSVTAQTSAPSSDEADYNELTSAQKNCLGQAKCEGNASICFQECFGIGLEPLNVAQTCTDRCFSSSARGNESAAIANQTELSDCITDCLSAFAGGVINAELAQLAGTTALRFETIQGVTGVALLTGLAYLVL
ncbi:hypothetical protein IWQ60_005342 [Tieghemiomyces parasiticus]|uniref:Uncharacterized protein n=1 Tax=Tieghemiomyces parasiticus TaxID=78921 RepID=A0A9W8DYJ5_9FUNG|nr:hypothetical protein IWQ60_005342 [Tieghemiomyces parasiticus]